VRKFSPSSRQTVSPLDRKCPFFKGEKGRQAPQLFFHLSLFLLVVERSSDRLGLNSLTQLTPTDAYLFKVGFLEGAIPPFLQEIVVIFGKALPILISRFRG